ncbi:MAG: hypothetical protein IIA05_10800 [Proteobacteria bacterium]|nr:hypothetical protein [Pseudomonadota bacterium]
MNEQSKTVKTDITGNLKSLLVVNGLPIVAILLSAYYLSETPRTVVWTLSFLVMGAACVRNALSCRRVHCVFTGPWFLLAALASLLHGTGFVDFGGPRGWELIGNIGLWGAFAVWIVSEAIWGKYFAESEIKSDA